MVNFTSDSIKKNVFCKGFKVYNRNIENLLGMAKTVISESDNLVKLQRKMRFKSHLYAYLLSFGIFFIYFLYIFIYCLGHSYYNWFNGFFNSVSSLEFWPYFPIEANLFDFSYISSLERFLLLVGIVILCIISYFTFNFFYMKKQSAIFQEKYFSSLVMEAKVNGVIFNQIDVKEDELNDNISYLKDLDFYSPNLVSSYQANTSLADLKMYQYELENYENKNIDGLLIVTSLTRVKTHAYIQFRTYGEPKIDRYDGLKINRYGFDGISNLANFICYTTLGPEIYLIVNKKVADAICELSFYVKTDISITIKEDKLIVLLEGFKFKLTKKLADKLNDQILEKQVEALIGLIQGVTNIVTNLNGEVNFAPEEKGNGILIY